MWKVLKFLFSRKKKRRVQFALPEPERSIEEEEDMKTDLELQAMIDEISESNAPAAVVEQQIKEIEAGFLKSGKVVELFHKAVVELRNERCEDEALETRDGTRRALQELSIYATNIDKLFKGVKVKNPADAESPDMVYYWSV